MGPVGVRDTYHFAYADGTPYHQVGTTCYAWAHQGDQLEEQTLEALAAAPFNKIRMCLFPKHYAYNLNEPEYLPFVLDAPGTDRAIAFGHSPPTGASRLSIDGPV